MNCTSEELMQMKTDIREAEEKLKAELRLLGFPEGFEPVFLYQDGRHPYIQKGVVRTSADGGHLKFQADWKDKDSLPVLPFRAVGKVYHSGWDIPTCWAIDGAGQCWADNAHGHSLSKAEAKDLLGMARAENDYLTQVTIHRVLGMKKPMPEWMKAALSAGWTPPVDFDRNEYEES